MRIFEHTNYRSYLIARIKGMPSSGKGQAQKIAQSLKIHPSLFSQVLRGHRDFTYEQGLELCEYLGLTDLETEVFMTWIQFERAGTNKLKRYFSKKISQLKEKSTELVERMPPDHVLTESERAIFYSNWYFSAIRMLTSIPEYQTMDAISERLELPKKTVSNVLQFLVKAGLCIDENGTLKRGPKHTHLGSDSPLVSRHHMNWRLRAIERHPRLTQRELAFTSPVSVGSKDVPKVREILAQAIEDCMSVIDPSESEKLMCLNIDWIDI